MLQNLRIKARSSQQSLVAGVHSALPSPFLLQVTYMGQAAYIIGHPDAYEDPFWNSVPHGAFWPMLVVATLTSGAPRAA
jgi:K+ transporter